MDSAYSSTSTVRLPQRRRGCRGATAVELVGITAALAVLAAAMTVPLASRGSDLAAAIDARLAQAAAGSAAGGARPARYEAHRAGAREHVSHAGELPLAGDDLHLVPVVALRAVRGWSTAWSDGRGQLRQHATASACVMCIGAGGRAHANLGATGAGDGDGPRRGAAGGGLGIEGRGHAHASLAAGEASYTASYTRRSLAARGQVRGAAGVGANLEGHGTLIAGRHRQELRLAGTAVAGAIARAEQRASLRFAGLALQATSGVEGWAGAGATGHLHLAHRGRGRYGLRLRGGGAWGLGGAFDIAGSIDASRLLANPGRTLSDVTRLLGRKERHQ